MMEITANGKVYQLNECGWLEDLEEWSEEVAVEIAKTVDVPQLTPEHWDVINLAREYFEDTGVYCEPRVFTKLMKKKFGKERSDQKYIYSLFPTGLIKCVHKIAGVPSPKECS